MDQTGGGGVQELLPAKSGWEGEGGRGLENLKRKSDGERGWIPRGVKKRTPPH